MNKQGPGKIEWCDFTWSPVSGCLHGCTYCYASAMAHRFKKSFEPAFHPDRLKEVEKVPAGSKVFVVSNGDLFGDWVPTEWVEKVLEATATRPDVTWQFLTKNPSRYAEFNPWPENVWLGATAIDTDMLHEAQKGFWELECGLKYISFEPVMDNCWGSGYIYSWFDWGIIGAMTGKGAIPPGDRRICELYSDLREHHIPVFMKSNIKPYWNGAFVQEFPK